MVVACQYEIKNPDKYKNMTYNVLLKGIRNVEIFKKPQIVRTSSTVSKTGSNALVKYSQ